MAISRSKVFLAAFIAVLFISAAAAAQDATDPHKIMDMVNKAAKYLSEHGDAGVDTFNTTDGPFTKGDDYVFVYKCEDGLLVGHPNAKLVGKNIKGIKDRKGNLFFVQICEVGENPQGGWVEYWWPKPGEKEASRKISYAIRAPGTPYTPAAGVYDDTLTVEELEKLIK